MYPHTPQTGSPGTYRHQAPTGPSDVNAASTLNRPAGTTQAGHPAPPRSTARAAFGRVLGLPPVWGFLPGLAALAGCAIAPRPTVVVAVLALLTATAHHLARWIGAPR